MFSTPSTSKRSGLSIIELERDLSVTAEGHNFREATPVIQSWPWSNGIPLHHRSMEDFLQNQLTTYGIPEQISEMILVCSSFIIICRKVANQMLQTIANRVDDYDLTGAFKDSNRGFLWEVLGGPDRDNGADPLNTVRDVGFLKDTDAKMTDKAMQVLCRYRLIDIFADVIQIPKHPAMYDVAPSAFHGKSTTNFTSVSTEFFQVLNLTCSS